MGMMDEFETGREWIEQNFDMNKMSGDVSVFETNIRYLGGFLSLYALTGRDGRITHLFCVYSASRLL